MLATWLRCESRSGTCFSQHCRVEREVPSPTNSTWPKWFKTTCTALIRWISWTFYFNEANPLTFVPLTALSKWIYVTSHRPSIVWGPGKFSRGTNILQISQTFALGQVYHKERGRKAMNFKTIGGEYFILLHLSVIFTGVAMNILLLSQNSRYHQPVFTWPYRVDFYILNFMCLLACSIFIMCIWFA